MKNTRSDLDTLMDLYNRPNPFPDDVLKTLPDEIQLFIEQLASVQLIMIDLFGIHQFSREDILSRVMTAGEFAKTIRLAIKGGDNGIIS